MQLKVNTNYAIRIVLYAAIKSVTGERISSAELSYKLGIPQSIVLKLGGRLKAAGIMDVVAGAFGGFKLKKSPEDISLFEIIDLFEPTTRINRCLEDDKYCSRFATDDCPVRNAYGGLQLMIEDRLKGITMQNLLDDQGI